MAYRDLVPDENLWREVVVSSRCGQDSAVDNDGFVYGYQLQNPRAILSAYRRDDGENGENEVNEEDGEDGEDGEDEEDTDDSWRNLLPMARWFEPIAHLQLAVKSLEAVRFIDTCCVGVIYFHKKE